jgi:hypothetical protein
MNRDNLFGVLLDDFRAVDPKIDKRDLWQSFSQHSPDVDDFLYFREETLENIEDFRKTLKGKVWTFENKKKFLLNKAEMKHDIELRKWELLTTLSEEIYTLKIKELIKVVTDKLRRKYLKAKNRLDQLVDPEADAETQKKMRARNKEINRKRSLEERKLERAARALISEKVKKEECKYKELLDSL